MARNHLYRLEPGNVLVLDVQADILDTLNTRVVVPLLPKSDAPTPARFLNPVFTIDGEAYVMVTQFLAAVSAKQLSEPVGDLAECFPEITRALDTLLQGF
ncbi:CcdB family protein [Labrenzia sp. 011]|uniref:CcdB family protein n=1 Tax=Labrenzia sp. 011 TaxID=2171494 RepID=UPI000D50ED3F|nr:CcdB family protein [Labrenzia sp. 011]PVB60391.1 plasmid maintenance protein CcdB [Labrenzia sp. 011]